MTARTSAVRPGSTPAHRHRRSPDEVVAYKSELIEALAKRIDALVEGNVSDLLEDPEQVADRMIAAVPRMHSHDELVGPFFTTDAVRRMLNDISRQAVHDRAARRTLLQVKTSDGVSLYPAFQFEDDRVSDRIRSVMTRFRGVPVDGWAIATWFSIPAESLDGLTPREWLADRHRDAEPADALARSTALRWSAP